MIGSILGALTLVSASIGFKQSETIGQTMAFTEMVLLELALVWLIRMPLSPMKNKKLLLAVVVSLALQIFHTAALSVKEWAILLGIACLGEILFACVLRIKFGARLHRPHPGRRKAP